MPELSCVSSAARALDTTDNWGGYLLPLENLDFPKYYEKHARIRAQRATMYLTIYDPYVVARDGKCASHVEIPLLMAYQLRDYLNKNLDDLAWRCAEAGFLRDDECKALAKFKKVYYEDEINNTETNNPEAEETEAKVSE